MSQFVHPQNEPKNCAALGDGWEVHALGFVTLRTVSSADEAAQTDLEKIKKGVKQSKMKGDPIK